jgi:4-aminobutyrate aminotransferase-like enzyme
MQIFSDYEIISICLAAPGCTGSKGGDIYYFGVCQGNLVAWAIARTALKVLVEEGLIENTASMDTYFLEGLKQISNPYKQ